MPATITATPARNSRARSTPGPQGLGVLRIRSLCAEGLAHSHFRALTADLLRENMPAVERGGRQAAVVASADAACSFRHTVDSPEKRGSAG